METLSIKDYFDEIKPYLSDIVNDHKTQGECKIKLTMKINFFSYKDSKETRTMYSHSDNIEVIISIEIDKIIEHLFDSFLQRYQKDLQESMRRSEFVFDNVDSLHYKLHKISLNRGESYIDSPKWLRNKNAAINPKNNDDKCFQYAITVSLNHEKIKSHPEIISNIKPFTDQHYLEKTGKSLNQIINQLLLIFCMCFIILKK